MGALEPDFFPKRLAERARETEAALDRLLPRADGPAGRVAEAMRYASLGGGKRLRAFLALESAAMLGAPPEGARRAAAALECVHAYSLIHDDLPAMDDDDLRRGRPTAHIAFDEATAILAGDALQALAFEILAAPQTHPSAQARCALVVDLARAAGAEGMVGGQMLDIEAEAAAAEGRRPTAPQAAMAKVRQLQRLKTGALIVAAARAGGILAQAGPDALQALETYADHLGLAFQIRDDLLDVEGEEGAAGKRLGKDAGAGKATLVEILGVQGARAAANDHMEAACAALSNFAERASYLQAAARFAVTRDA